MKKRILTAALVALMMLPMMGMTAYAGGGEEYDDSAKAESVETPITGGIEDAELVAAENPFTPSGTGTVVDTATDADGKEFYTITTPSENIFYLIIDRQRNTENVYFLNAVTETDLMALAEISETAAQRPAVEPPAPVQTEEPDPEPEPEPEKGSGMGSILLVVLILLGGGGAGWYFKIYKPKQLQADSEDEFEYLEDDTESGLYDEDESDPYGDDLYGDDDGDDLYGGNPDGDEDDSPPWDEDDNE